MTDLPTEVEIATLLVPERLEPFEPNCACYRAGAWHIDTRQRRDEDQGPIGRYHWFSLEPWPDLGEAVWIGDEEPLVAVATYGRFLLAAGPMRWWLRMDDYDGIYLEGTLGYYSFWPQVDGTVRVLNWENSHKPDPPPSVPARLKPNYPKFDAFFQALGGPLCERLLDTSPEIVGVALSLTDDWDGDLLGLLDVAERLA